MKQCAYYNEGKTDKITFVFSCPGQEEKKAGKPVAGQTGRNLEILIENLDNNFLKRVLGENLFKQWEEFTNKNKKNEEEKRYFFKITNTTEKELFYAKDKKTEENKKIIDENLERLNSQIKNAEWIFCFGNNAKYAIETLKQKNCIPNSKIGKARHLGLQSLNQISEDIEGNKLIPREKGNTEKRIQFVIKKELGL